MEKKREEAEKAREEAKRKRRKTGMKRRMQRMNEAKRMIAMKRTFPQKATKPSSQSTKQMLKK